ncbi:helix-turn-helix domain-containing protein [Paenibacillus mucilaginosus]|uniref:Transcriptional regulator, AraC family n=1 Tax=Paenibacillus mucilaginosus (strain KNP414) TaxID=1036673 RepID=F8FGN4_PAEMK|nr:AraC family transcriptional regulator [Paenibacillus mucilaginosus]AEI45411.1 transcriptional regulator, AraC family [Paenibacillus mucilaginosus KNP414]MCG7217954.1 AraC family transcriptional regulator [Paenibacillus mucilaginosus]
MDKKHCIPALPETPLPLYLESVGLNPEQERISRPQGYPVYHWLLTVRGEGVITFAGRQERLPVQTAVLLPPHLPHVYEGTAGDWATAYVTFDGAQAEGILASLGLPCPSVWTWNTAEGENSMKAETQRLLAAAERQHPGSLLELSCEVYRFLAALKQFGMPDRLPSLSDALRVLEPVTRWLEAHYGDPGIGMPEIASVLGHSPRHLTTLFRRAYGTTPYAYLLSLRIRKAKELLGGGASPPIHVIAGRVGFRDASHFIATFRRLTGMTPEQYRSLH